MSPSTTFKGYADQLAALAAEAPGAELATVTLIWGHEISLHCATAESRVATAAALGMASDGELLGEATRPLLQHERLIDLDGEQVTVTVYGPRDPK